jgi:hypothetical protein
MHPLLKRLNASEAKLRGTRHVLHITGGIPGDTSPVTRIDAGRLTIIGRLPQLEVEDDPTVQDVAQDSVKEAG